jgi:serine/threonine protein phosphatase PrpC
MSTPHDADTVEITLPFNPSGRASGTLSSRVEVDLAGLSHRGKVRPNNEDHFLIVRFGRFLETLSSNLSDQTTPQRAEEIGYGMVVADGVGGHAAGEQASRLAINGFLELVLATPDWILRADDDAFLEEIVRRASWRFGKINALLTDRARDDPNIKGMATTLTAAWSLGKDLLVAHVGDSRAYLFRENKLHRLTRDHTLAQEMADMGVVSPDELARHKLRHVLTNLLGDVSGNAPPDVQRFSLEDDDCVLLCSDGLTEMVADERLAALIGAAKDSKTLCEELVDAALRAGGKDNVTVAAARYRLPSSG